MKAKTLQLHEATGEPRLLTKAELAAELQVTTRTVSEWQRKGWIPHLKIGGGCRYQWPQLLATLEKRFGQNWN